MTVLRFQRRYQGPLRGIILDWAGTTMDFGCLAPARVFVEVFARQGVEISMSEARVPMGAHKKVHIRALTKIPEVAQRWRSVHGQAPGEADVERMFEDFIPLQLACLPEYSDLTPGCLEVVADIRRRGLKIGSTTGYTLAMMAVLTREGKQRGYEPDVSVSAEEVPEGRPAPWMCLENARRLGIYPMPALVKVDDTLPGVEEGLNAGMWAIALAVSGNEVGRSLADYEAMPEEERQWWASRARDRMARTGAHYVVDDIRGVPACLDDIDRRLRAGEAP